MGIIRKTASISTLGLVSFRSKKERLRRAESDYANATEQLLTEQTARSAADQRVAEAERRAHAAELAALHEAKLADKRGRKLEAAKTERSRRGRRKAAARARRAESSMRESVNGLVSAAQPVLAAGTRRARRGGRAARRRAEHTAAAVTPRVEEMAHNAKERAAELAERARDTVDI